MKIRLAVDDIQRDSIVDGEGIRSVIWTQGCPHHCPGCHNPETHAFDEGTLVDLEDVMKKIDTLEYHDGVTFSGGDPMIQAEACSKIAKYCHKKNLNVWCYTGYTFEQLLRLSLKNKFIMDFLKQIDVLVDGKFILKEKSYDVIYRGSRNQRLIDVRKSLAEKRIILLTKYEESMKNDMGRKNQYVFV